MRGLQGKGQRFGTTAKVRLALLPRIALMLAGLIASCPVSVAQRASLVFPGTTKVGTSSSAVTVTLTAQIAGSASAPVALTSGAANQDFSIADPGSCGSNPTLAAGQSCNVSVVFSPRYPGVRHGAVLLRSADGTQTLASARLSGIGSGGLPVLVPGQINTVAGNGQWVYRGDGVAATAAPIFLPTGLAVDGAGNLFFSDSSNNRVRRVDAATGLISTIAGNGVAGGSGDDGAASSAELNNPSGLALDGAGNLFIADSGNNVVRRVDAVTGLITTVVGKIGESGYAGDGGPAVDATLTSPQGIALTPGGDLVVADSGNAVVRLVTFSDGGIQTIAGTGVPGYNGDGIAATAAQLNSPWGVAVRSDGAVAIADFNNERVRLINAGGNISTVAGTGQRSFSGDGSAATEAALSGPAAVAFDPAGDVIIADSGNNRVRGVYGAPGIITTLAGNSSEEFSGDAGPGSSATLYGPYGIVFDAQGNIWISDMFHNRVREISGSVLGIAFPKMKVGKTSSPFPEMLYNAGDDNLTLSAPVLNQGALDPNTTTCGQSALAPTVFCDMGVEFAPTQVGQNVAGSVSWPSDAPNVTPVDDLDGQVLSVEPTSVSLAASANPGLLGQPVTLTATVNSADAGRTGTVTFSEGGQVWCNAIALATDGTASCQIPSLSLGSHSFMATYSGDDNNAGSSSQAYLEIIKQQAALALAVSSSPSVVTSNVTLTLTAADGTGTPTGNVVFFDGSTALATVPLNSSGIATWSTQSFSVGSHSLSAQYSGDSANVAGTSNTAAEEIDPATTLAVLASSSSDVTVGTPITLTATVASNNGPAPTGSVQFVDASGSGEVVLGSVPLSAGGMAAMTVSSLDPGVHSLVARYSGDGEDAQSNSASLSQTIEQIATVTSLGADANPLNAGATLHLSALVSLPPGATAVGSLSGDVTFRDGTSVLGAVAINSSGQATLAATSLAVGQHVITASFGGGKNYAPSSSISLSETVQQTAVQVSLSSVSTSTLMGKPASFSVAVTSATGIPTGTVSFRDGNTVLGTATLDAKGDANFTSSLLAQGTHDITCTYGGDSNYLPGTSETVQETVQLAQPTVTLTGPTGPLDAGTVVQLRASLATPGASPTGALTLYDGATVLGTEPATGVGNYLFSTSGLAIGTHLLTAAYSGDSGNAVATSAPIAVLIQQAPSTVMLSASANPLTQGAPLTLTASIASDSPNPTGTVNFFDGTSLLATAPVASTGVASTTIANLGLGAHSITAVYSGDMNHAGSSSTSVQELVVRSATATLVSSNNPSASGQNVILTVQVSGAGSLVPTGQVVLRDGASVLATVSLDGTGVASFGTSALSVGSHALSTAYGGDQNFAPARAQLIQTVTNAATQVTLTPSANPSQYGQPLTLTAAVVSNGGVASGPVAFTDGGTQIGVTQLGPSGIGTFATSTLAPGVHTVTATYEGDGKASGSVSAPITVAVKQSTALHISADTNPSLTLSPVTFTVTVTNAGASPATGMVSFTEGASLLGTAAVDAAGRAVLTLPQMTAGSHSIAASYAGDDGNFPSASLALNEEVQLRSTLTTVTGSSTDPTNPQQVTLIAVIKGQGSVPPSGTVSFTNGAVTLGVAPVDATGVATITVLFEQTSERLIASYSGDVSYAPSASSSTAIAAGEAPQFTLAVDAASVTVAARQHLTMNVSVSSVKGFADTITLGCLGLPYAATCTFNNSQLALTPNGAATAKLIIDTGNPLGAGSGSSASLLQSRAATAMCCLPGGLLLVLIRRRNRRTVRRVSTMVLLAVALAVCAATEGCSGLSVGSTPPGTYVFKVVGTGQGSSTTQAQTITLVVTE